MRFVKIQQRGQAVCFGGFALQLVHLHFQLVVFTVKLFIFAGGILQREIVTPGVAQVADAVGAGDITPDEGQAVASILEAKRKAIETVDLEARLSALEKERK